MAVVKYIIDSGPFIDMRHYYNDVFISLWDKIENYLNEEIIISSIEVYRELERRDDDIKEIANKYKFIFKKPEIEEQKYVKEILNNHKELIKQRNISGGLPVADPFLIAQAVCHRAILITSESFKLMHIMYQIFAWNIMLSI